MLLRTALRGRRGREQSLLSCRQATTMRGVRERRETPVPDAHGPNDLLTTTTMSAATRRRSPGRLRLVAFRPVGFPRS
jgi:hypothetical protein